MDKTLAVFLVLFVSSILAFNYFLLLTHESAHQRIFEYFGVPSEVRIGFLSGSTVPDGNVFVSADVRREVYALQALNDVMGYQVVGLFNVLVGFNFLFFIFTRLFESKNRGGFGWGKR
jgi:hypothetical protein